jgi:hypothetical protein
MRQFASHILAAVGVFAIWQGGLATGAWVGCVMGAGFKACEAPARAAQDTVGGLITLGLGLLYQNHKDEP